MYIYKRQKNKYHLVDFVDSKDEFTIEERIIKIIRKEKDLQDITKVKSKFTGLFTVYYFGGKFAIITSDCPLNEDGTEKIEMTMK